MSHAKAAAPQLDFMRVAIEVSDGGSLALLFEQLASRCGIYWIDFANGDSYIGQSVTARSRLATHRRRWSDAVAVGFAACPLDQLDLFERATISYVEQSRPLRNKLLTARPGGAGDLVVTTRAGASLSLPWERCRRTPASAHILTDQVGQATARQSASFARLRRMPEFEALRQALTTVLAEAVPVPHATQSVLWTLTALPSTSRGYGQRLATLNAGRLEILWAFRPSGDGDSVFLNLDPEVDLRELRKLLRRVGLPRDAAQPSEYSHMTSVVRIGAGELTPIVELLAEPLIQDAIYRLVVRMMRQGLNPLARHHNWDFAADVLAGVPRTAS